MEGRPMAAVALVAVLLLAGCSAGFQPQSGPAPATAEESSTDHLGYYDGYWYNDTFDIDPSEGLTGREKEALVSRAMARVQLLRGLEFEERVEVDLLTREEFRSEFRNGSREGPGEGVRALDNAQHEALFLVGPDEDVVEVRRANRGTTVLGFYQPGSERLIVVSANDPATLDDEITLAHELLHALQDQHFDLSSVSADGTLDGVNARNGLIEGDATVVEQAYERNCETGEWECVEAETGTPGAPSEEFHVGVYFVGFFPYAEGPSFVQYHRDRGGWAAIDAMYDDVPSTSAEIVHPGTYGTDAYGGATVTDRNAAGWERVTTGRGPDYATVGQSGLAAMFAYTAFEGDRPGVIDPDEFRNLDEEGRLERARPFTYDVGYAEGWYADRLHAYRDGEGRAHVWNVTFDDEANATEFREGYERVVEYWGGERLETPGNATRWTFDGTGTFDGAVWIERDDNAVTIAKAPTPEDLGEVHAPAGDR